MQVETLFTLSLPNKTADIQEWIKLIGLPPIGFCIKGQRVSNKPYAIISEDSFLTFGVKRQEENSVQTQLNRVIDQLYAKKAIIDHLIKRLGLETGCASFAWAGENKELITNFDADTLRKITELGADFSLTRYRY